MLAENYTELIPRFFHILTQPMFPTKSLAKYKKIYSHKLSQHKERIATKARTLFKQTIYKDRPFGWNWDDALKEIKSLEQQDLIAFHKKNVVRNNMTVAIVGNINSKDIENLISSCTQHWEQSAKKIETSTQP